MHVLLYLISLLLSWNIVIFMRVLLHLRVHHCLISSSSSWMFCYINVSMLCIVTPLSPCMSVISSSQYMFCCHVFSIFFSVLLYYPHVDLITSSSRLSPWSISIFVLCHFISFLSFYIFIFMYVIPSLFKLSSCFVFGFMNDFLHVYLYLCLFTSLSPCKSVSVFVSIYAFLSLHLHLLSVVLHHFHVGLIT